MARRLLVFGAVAIPLIAIGAALYLTLPPVGTVSGKALHRSVAEGTGGTADVHDRCTRRQGRS